VKGMGREGSDEEGKERKNRRRNREERGIFHYDQFLFLALRLKTTRCAGTFFVAEINYSLRVFTITHNLPIYNNYCVVSYFRLRLGLNTSILQYTRLFTKLF